MWKVNFKKEKIFFHSSRSSFLAHFNDMVKKKQKEKKITYKYMGICLYDLSLWKKK